MKVTRFTKLTNYLFYRSDSTLSNAFSIIIVLAFLIYGLAAFLILVNLSGDRGILLCCGV